MNRVIITGNVVAAPEAYTTQSGISRSSFKVAVQRKFRNANGEREADFLPVVVWRQAAEYCNKYFEKGCKVSVEGSIQNRSYDAKDGTKHYITEIVAESVELLSRPQNTSGNGNSRPQQSQAQKAEESAFTEVEDDDDLPF